MRLEKMKLKPIDEQTIVITGASSGIGLATARLAAKKGANVVLSSRNGEEVERLAAEIRERGGRAIGVAADVRSLADLERLRDEALREFGGIDTWVNNAGTSLFGPVLETPVEEEKELFETNFWGVRHGSHVAVGELRKRGGTLINLGSELSGSSVPLQTIYAATKHAVKAYTDGLRMEVEKQNLPIAVSLVRPAGIDTPFAEHAVNRLPEGEPSLPPPVYRPEVVARAIVTCAEAPQRDVYVGGPSRLFTIMDTLFPRLNDFLIEGTMFSAQSKGGTRPHDPKQEALWSAPARQGRTRGNHRGITQPVSLYTAASQRPLRALTVLAGIAVAAGAIRWALQQDRAGFSAEAEKEEGRDAAAAALI